MTDSADLAALLDRLPLGVAVHRAGETLYRNAAFARLAAGLDLLSQAADGAPVLWQRAAEDGSPLWLEARRMPVLWQGADAVETRLEDVTRRILAEAEQERLREAEAQGLAILSASPIGISVGDREGNLFFINEHGLRMHGYEDAGSFLRLNANSHYADPSVRARMKEALYRDGSVPETEVAMRRRNGDVFWALMTSKVIPWGKRSAHITWIYEITERREAEALTRENEQRLFSILATSPVGVNISTRDGTHLFANESAIRLMGHRDWDSYRQANAHDEYPDPAERIRLKDALYRDGHTPETEVQLRRTDGRLIWVLMNSRLIEFAGWQAHITWSYDITERRESEVAIAENERRLRSVTDNLPGAVLRLTQAPDGTIRVPFINSGVEALLGTPPDRITDAGDGIDFLIPLAERERFVATLRQARDERRQALFEYATEAPGVPARWLRFMSFPRLDTDGSVIWDGLLLDSTEWKKADIAKRSFVSMVSHELRTPLTSIRGSLGLIAGGTMGPVPERMMRLIQIANSNSERLTRLINDLLDIEKIEAERLEFDIGRHPLAGLLRQAVEANAGFGMPRRVAIALLDPMPEAELMVDADRFIQVMSNLLSNAIKYSPEGGRVDVSATADAGSCIIRVRDYGPGIPPEFQTRIFERFSQADVSDKRARSGTGLGLSIAKAIIEHHGGNIRFETSAEGGTSFFVKLPIRQAETEPVIDCGHTVLICEDDTDAAEVIAAMAAKSGFAAQRAHSAAQARSLLAGGTSFAALLLDLALPDEDGILLLDDLRRHQRTATLPVVVISAYADDTRHRSLASRFGVADWFNKPVDEDRLSLFLRGLGTAR